MAFFRKSAQPDSDEVEDLENPDESDMDDGDDPELIPCPFCREPISEEAEVCPHCRNPIELVPSAVPEEVVCPSCGSSFNLEQRSSTEVATAPIRPSEPPP